MCWCTKGWPFLWSCFNYFYDFWLLSRSNWKEKIIWYPASCWYSFSGKHFRRVPPWAACGVGDMRQLFAVLQLEVFVSYQWGQKQVQQPRVRPKLCSYMCMHFNAISWHLLEQCVVLPLGIHLERSWTLETSLTLSQQTQYDVFSTRERRNRCMLVFLLFVWRILWMPSRALRFLHVVLPFNCMAVAHLDERCSLHKQLKSHVHRIF